MFVCAASVQAASLPQIIQGVISKVVDGDTVNVTPRSFRGFADSFSFYADADQVVKVRMLGMDAAEVHFPAPGHGIVGQPPFGEEAAAYLGKMVQVGMPVALQAWGYDKYQRTLAYVVNDKKYDVNLQMVRGGYAVPYEICSGKTCTKQWFTDNRVREYLMSCDAARQEKRGIFNPARPLKELPFEFRMRMGNRQPEKYVGDYDTMKLYQPKDYKKVDVCRRIFFLTKTEALKIGFKEAR